MDGAGETPEVDGRVEAGGGHGVVGGGVGAGRVRGLELLRGDETAGVGAVNAVEGVLAGFELVGSDAEEPVQEMGEGAHAMGVF